MIITDKLVVPLNVRQGIRHTTGGFKQDSWVVMGWDTETVDGVPHTIQMSVGGEADLFYVGPKNILDTFLMYLYSLQVEKIVAFAHYTTYDFPVLFRNQIEHFRLGDEVKFEHDGWEIEFVYGKVNFGRIRHRTRHIECQLLDTFSFFKTSLDDAAKKYGISVRKLAKPKGLGKFPLASPEFEEYAKQDAVVVEKLGALLVDMHRDLDVSLSVSAPHLAAKVFRHNYIPPGVIIPFPDKATQRAAELSYHGGKNGLYNKPGWYGTGERQCIEYDINSAYPKAMTLLPSPNGRYVKTNRYTEDHVGIWVIDGYAPDNRYKPLMTNDGKPLVGRFKGVAVTSHELKAALEYGNVRVERMLGFLFECEGGDNPWRHFVEDIYAQRQAAPKGSPQNLFLKLIMNSLYGKSIARVRHAADGQNESYDVGEGGKLIARPGVQVAGALYNPFVASLITGHVRSVLYRAEEDYDAIHSSTDSIKTLRADMPESDTLGEWKREIVGPCLIVRNKVYVHFNEDRSKYKAATHGLTGLPVKAKANDDDEFTQDDLFKLLYERRNGYDIKRIVRPKESFRRKTNPAPPLSVEQAHREIQGVRLDKIKHPKWFLDFLKEQVG